jgi:hypothetical protein
MSECVEIFIHSPFICMAGYFVQQQGRLYSRGRETRLVYFIGINTEFIHLHFASAQWVWFRGSVEDCLNIRPNYTTTD